MDMPGIQFGRFAPSVEVPEGRMLAVSGSLTVTITSRATSRHMTLRMRCSRRSDGPKHWPTVPFADATHVFIDDFDGEQIALFDPRRGVLAFSRHATPAAQWTVGALLRYLSGVSVKLTAQAEIAASSHCLKCGRELSDPESLERGYGPDCWGELTGSVPQAAVASV
jgi:Family of unknown function (DUF6011)